MLNYSIKIRSIFLLLQFSGNNKIDEVEALQKSINSMLIEGKDIILNISKIKDNFTFFILIHPRDHSNPNFFSKPIMYTIR